MCVDGVDFHCWWIITYDGEVCEEEEQEDRPHVLPRSISER